MQNSDTKINNTPHRFLYRLLGGITILLFYGCGSPVDYEAGSVQAQYDSYIVHGYVTRNGNPVVNQEVRIYIRDYRYSSYETTYTNDTNYRGYYRFTVYFKEYNYRYYTLYCQNQQAEGRVFFGRTDRIDFEL